MPGFLARLGINMLGLLLANELISGVDISGLGTFIAAALLLGIVNALVRPVAILLTLPLTIVTLGSFLFVINAMMLLLTAWLSGIFDLGLHVSGFGSAFAAGLMISLTSLLLSFVVGEREVRVVRH